MRRTLHPYVTVGVALVGAGVIAVTPVTAPPPDVHMPDIQLTAGEAQDIVIDFVRHSQTNPSGDVVAVATNGVPGFPLSTLGDQQATDIGNTLFNQLGGVEGIFGGQEQRMIETAAPFATLENMAFQPLAGFNEISGGIYAGAPPSSLGDVLYELTVAAWAFGLVSVPMTGSNDFNGVQFDQNFGNAVDTIYTDAINDPDPVISANSQITDVVVSGGGAISAWPLMNVNNPDVAVFIPLLLGSLSSGNANNFISNASITEIQGNPTDGWTLISFEGQAMPAYPGLLTELILDLRNVIAAPQIAAYNLQDAVINGDPTAIEQTLLTGLQNVGTATVQFPGSVVSDIVDAAQKLSDAVAGGETFSDAFGSVIVGLIE